MTTSMFSLSMSTPEGRFARWLENATTEPNDTPFDKTTWTELKSFLQTDARLFVVAFDALWKQLRCDHSLIRLRANRIFRYLVPRSHVVRNRLMEYLTDWMLLSTGFGGEETYTPLPSPAVFAEKLQQEAAEMLSEWCKEFGKKYRNVTLADNFIKKQMKQARPLVGRNQAAARRRMEQQQRTMASRLMLFWKNYDEWKASRETICEIISATTELCKILVPTLDDAIETGPVEPTGDRAISLARLGLPHSSYKLDILIPSERPLDSFVKETEENTEIFDQIRSNHALICRYRRSVQRWLTHFTKAEWVDDEGICIRTNETFDQQSFEKFKENTLREVIDSKKELTQVADMCEEIGVKNDVEDTDEDEMIEVPVTDTSAPVESEINPTSEQNTMQQPESVPQQIDADKSNGATENETKNDLLKRAPFIEYDDDLFHWETKELYFNTTGIDFHHRFYGDGTGENKVSQETLESLKKRTRIFSMDKMDPEKVELKPCRFPMGNGRVCPRKHADECTFHGKIIPRNPDGSPINAEDISEAEKQLKSKPLWLQIEDDINAATGGESSKRKTRHQELQSMKKQKTTSVQRIKKMVEKPDALRRNQEVIIEEAQRRERDRKVNKW